MSKSAYVVEKRSVEIVSFGIQSVLIFFLEFIRWFRRFWSSNLGFSQIVNLSGVILDPLNLFFNIVLYHVEFWFDHNFFIAHNRFSLYYNMSKRAASASVSSPGPSGKGGSPKKPKTPPKKKKEDMVISQGEPVLIHYYRASGCKLWTLAQRGDRSDAFMKNIVDHIRSATVSKLRDVYDVKSDLTRRVSLERDEPMKNFRKAYERKVLVQVSDIDTKEHDIETAKEFQKVRLRLYISNYCSANS